MSFDLVPGCWTWTGRRAGSKTKYGVTYVERPLRRSKSHGEYVHLLSYRIYKGEIPVGHEVDHLCRNILCLNPDHLEAVSPAENKRRTRLSVCRKGLHDLTSPEAAQWDAEGRRRGCKQCARDRALAHFYRLKGKSNV